YEDATSWHFPFQGFGHFRQCSVAQIAPRQHMFDCNDRDVEKVRVVDFIRAERIVRRGEYFATSGERHPIPAVQYRFGIGVSRTVRVSNPLNKHPCWRERPFECLRGLAVKRFWYRIGSGDEMLVSRKKTSLILVHSKFDLKLAAGGFQIHPHEPGANLTNGKNA